MVPCRKSWRKVLPSCAWSLSMASSTVTFMDKPVFESPNVGRLPLSFYLRTDVVQIARDLLGKVLVTEIDGQRTAGRITETEAYRAPDDKACHAFGNRRTARTEVMFQEGGRAYVYLCYGIHHLFNVVTAPEDAAHAVLIRAIEPIEGQEIMMVRRGVSKVTRLKSQVTSLKSQDTSAKLKTNLTTGPGAMSQALGLTTGLTGQSLMALDSPVWIEADGMQVSEEDIAEGPRIGVDFAGECAAWHWRFWVKNSPFVKK